MVLRRTAKVRAPLCAVDVDGKQCLRRGNHARSRRDEGGRHRRRTIFSLADITVPWAGFIGRSPTPEVVTFTEPWWKLVRHAAEECQSVGARIDPAQLRRIREQRRPMDYAGAFHAGSRLVAGARLRRSAVQLTLGPTHRRPAPAREFPKVYIPSSAAVGIPEVPGRKDYYRDVAVLAVPAEGAPPVTAVSTSATACAPTATLSLGRSRRRVDRLPLRAHHHRSDDSARAVGRDGPGVRQDEQGSGHVPRRACSRAI